MANNKSCFLALIVVFLLLTGCRGGREYYASSVKVDENQVLPDREASEEEKENLIVKTTPEGDEVLVYELEQACDRAVRYNIELLTVYDEYRLAESGFVSAKSEFQVELTPTIERNLAGSDGSDNYRFSLNATKKNRLGTTGDVEILTAKTGGGKNSALRFSLDQPLMRGASKLAINDGLFDARREIARALRTIELEKEQTVLDVISNYYDIIREKKIVDLNEKSVVRTRELMEVARANLKISNEVSKQESLELDVYRAEIQLAQAENNLINAHQSLGDALDNFKILLGYNETVNVDIVYKKPAYEKVAVNEAEAVGVALEHRLDYREAWDRIWDAERNEKVAKNDLLPDLSIVMGLSGVGETYDDAVGFDETRWFVGFSTSSDIRRVDERENYTRAVIQTRTAKRSYILLQDQIVRQVRQAIRRLERDYQRIKLQEKTMEHAEQQYDLAKARYEQSQKEISDVILDNDDVVEAEADLILAETNLTFAVTDYIISQARLKAILGTLTEKSPEVYSIGYFDD
jgi:outer membrane protein